MAELAAAGAAAFTDDGRPVVSAGLMRRALQYSALTDLRLALHCEEPSLSRGGHVHEGAVSAELGLGPYPSTAESVMVERDLALAAAEGAPDPPHAPLGARVRRRARARARGGRRGDRRGHAAPPRPHRRGGSLARPEHEDEPAAARGRRPRGAARRAPARRDLVRRDRSRAARAAREGRAVRGGAVRRHRARDGVRGALHPPRRSRASSRSRRCSSGCRPARRARSASTSRASRSARARTSSRSTSTPSGR